MKQEEIIEGNILIAKFDGWILGETEYYCAGVPERHPRWIKDKEELLTSDLLYHSSWDWIMPAYKKFDRLNVVSDFSQYSKYCDEIDIALTTYDIEIVFITLVNGIKWLKEEQNENK